MKRVFILFFWLCLLTAAAQTLELHFIDVGQGDAVFIRAPGGQGVLYDGGRRTKVVLEYLQAIGVTRVDLIVASHPDADHIAGLIAVVSAYRPRLFMDNGLPHTTQTYFDLLNVVEAAGSQLLEPNRRRIALGDVIIEVLPPPGIAGMGNNDNSVGLVIEYGDFRAALTGDAEAPEFAWWLDNVPELLSEVDVYKSSHHGSRNGDGPANLIRFRPQTVLIGVGEGNSYNHPTDRALRLYRAIGADIYRTDLNGTVVIEAWADGSYTVTPERGEAFVPVPATEVKLERDPEQRLEVTCILYNPEGRDAGRETVTVTALDDVDTTGWYLEDERGGRLELPATTLAFTDTLSVTAPGTLWNNSGDTASLFDPAGELVSVFSYGGGGRLACR